MDPEETEATPAEKWQASLNATCNRLTTQYVSLLKAAAGISTAVAKSKSSSSTAADSSSITEGRRGGGIMLDKNDPPPALAADAALVSLQTKLTSQNIAVASSNLLDLIRTLRLSALLMDEQVINEEEQHEFEICKEEASDVSHESALLEAELFKLWKEEIQTSYS